MRAGELHDQHRVAEIRLGDAALDRIREDDGPRLGDGILDAPGMGLYGTDWIEPPQAAARKPTVITRARFIPIGARLACQLVSFAGGASYVVVLTDYAGACVEAQAPAVKPRSASVSIQLPGAVAGTTYPVDAVHVESGTVVSFDTNNPDCTSGPPGGYATGGHVTISAASGTSLSGSFELTFDVVTSKGTEPDTISGTFVAPLCAGAFEAMSSAQQITCR